MTTNLSELEPLIGRWSTTITMIHPPESKGERYRAVDTYRWLGGHSVVVHEVQARMGEAMVNSLEVYTTAGGGITSRNFDSTGSVSDYSARMTDAGWRVEGETERFSSSSISGDIIEGLWQLKVDGSWVDWMTVCLERVATD
jgi:hypothetical protein